MISQRSFRRKGSAVCAPTITTSTLRGYKEEATTTPFDMVMLNDLDRFHLVMDVQGSDAPLAEDELDAPWAAVDPDALEQALGGLGSADVIGHGIELFAVLGEVPSAFRWQSSMTRRMLQRPTICRAIAVTCSRSDSAPVVIES